MAERGPSGAEPLDEQDLLWLSRQVLDAVHSGVVVARPAGGDAPIVYVNAAFEAMTGYARAEVLGRDCRLLQGADRAQDGIERLHEAIRAGQACRATVRNYRKDGRMFWNEVSVAPVRDRGGAIRFFVGIQNDVTGYGIAEPQAGGEGDSRSVIESLKEVVFRADAKGQWQFLNAAWTELTGFGRKDTIGRPLLDFVHPDDRAHVSGLQEALGSGHRDHGRCEVKFLTRGGGFRWMEVYAKRMGDAGREGAGTAGTLNDITDRKTAEAELQEHAHRLDTVLALSPDGFISLDDTGCVLFANPAFHRMTGLTVDRVKGLSIPELDGLLQSLCDPAHPYEAILSTAVPAPPSGRERRERPRHNLHLVRPELRVLERTVAGTGASPKVIFFRDVTRMTEVDRLKSEFLSTAAHELRTPMASVYGFAELLLKRDYDEGTRRELVSTIHRQAGHLTNVLNELLDLARIEARAGKDFRFLSQPLGPIVEEAVGSLLVPNDDRRVDVQMPAKVPDVVVDSEKLQQALTNLLSNAYKYSPAGGRISLEVFEVVVGTRARNVGIRVTDQGMGMTPEQLSRAFERFYRADVSGKIPGTGLGLALVREIVELHGGRVELESRAGEGTSATIWLPVSQSEP
jgi:PAS domain S-box-containing protein